MKLRTCALLLADFFLFILPAQQKEQGTIINEVQMYVSPDLNSQKLARATRGKRRSAGDGAHQDRRTNLGARADYC